MFLSDSHSDGTHSLQSIHCWDTDAMLHFSKSDEDTNSSTSRMAINVILTHELLYFSWAGFWGSSGSEPSMGDKSLYTSRNKSLIQQVTMQTHGGFFVVHCDSSCNKLLFLWVRDTMRSVSFSHFNHIPRCLFAPDYAYLTLWDLSQRSILRLTGRISSFMAYSLIYWEARSHWLTVISSLKHTSTHARTNMHASVFGVALHEFHCTAWDLLMCLDIHTEGLCVCNGVFEVGVQ